MKFTGFILLFFVMFFSTGCQKDASSPDAHLSPKDFLVKNRVRAGVQTRPSGLQYEILRAGTGKIPKLSDSVKVHYKGTLLNGTVFDSSENGVQFELSKLITGFAEGITYFNVGGKGTLIIPPNLGYGSSGVSGTIPRNAVLIFEIQIISLDN